MAATDPGACQVCGQGVPPDQVGGSVLAYGTHHETLAGCIQALAAALRETQAQLDRHDGHGGCACGGMG